MGAAGNTKTFTHPETKAGKNPSAQQQSLAPSPIILYIVRKT